METKEEELLKKMHMASSTGCTWKSREAEGIPGCGHFAVTCHPQITFNRMRNKWDFEKVSESQALLLRRGKRIEKTKVRDPNRLHPRAFLFLFFFYRKNFWMCLGLLWHSEQFSLCAVYNSCFKGSTQTLSSIRHGVSFFLLFIFSFFLKYSPLKLMKLRLAMVK